MPIVGQRVNRLRTLLGFSQGELAAWLHINRSYLSEIENGHVENVGTEIVSNLAKGLSTSTDYLLGLTDEPILPQSDSDLTALEERIMHLFRLLPIRLQELTISQLDLWLDHRDQWGTSPEDDDEGAAKQE